jgi:hypothetical protein
MNSTHKNNFILDGAFFASFAVSAAFAAVLVVPTFVHAQDSDYGSNTYSAIDYGTNTYQVTDYGTNTYQATNYADNSYQPTDYGTNTYSTTDYGTNTYSAVDYGTNTYQPIDYGTNTYSAVDYGTNTYQAIDYGTNTYAAVGYGTNTYTSTDYGTNTYTTTPYSGGSTLYTTTYYPSSGYYGSGYYGGGYYGGGYYGGYSYPTFSYPTYGGGGTTNTNTNVNYSACNGTNNCNVTNNPAPTVAYSSTGYSSGYYINTPPSYPVVYGGPVVSGSTPSVNLSQIPYTGLELGFWGTIAYWGFLIFWCLFAAYLITVKRIQNKFAAFLFGDAVQVEPAHAPAAHAPAHRGHTELHTQTGAHTIADPIDPFILSQIEKRIHA